MKKRLVWLVECVHGYESGCSFGDCVGGTYEPIEIDYAAGGDVLADESKKVHKGWNPLEFGRLSELVVDAAIGRDE